MTSLVSKTHILNFEVIKLDTEFKVSVIYLLWMAQHAMSTGKQFLTF